MPNNAAFETDGRTVAKTKSTGSLLECQLSEGKVNEPEIGGLTTEPATRGLLVTSSYNGKTSSEFGKLGQVKQARDRRNYLFALGTSSCFALEPNNIPYIVERMGALLLEEGFVFSPA